MGSQLKMGFSREQNLVRSQPKPLRPKPRQHQGHFDPEELTRRLYIVLADQKADAERKKARTGELANLMEPRPWNMRNNSSDEAAGRRSKEAPRDAKAATAQSSQHTSLKHALSTSSGELKRQKSSKLNAAAARKAPKAISAKEVPSKSAAEAPPVPTTYHHVPQEAAKQFQRTTTVAPMRDSSSSAGANLTHKLSKQALKLHLAAGGTHSTHHLRPPLIEEQQQQPVSPVERLLKDRERVDHWRSNIPDDPVLEEEDEEYHIAPQYPPDQQQQQREQYSFRAELERLRHPTHSNNTNTNTDQNQNQNRRNSTGDILARASSEDNRLSMVLVERPALADVLEEGAASSPDEYPDEHHRVDWTQSDEQRAAAASAAAAASSTSAAETSTAPPSMQQRKPLLSPLLKKADSIWTLRGRLGGGSGGGSSRTQQQDKAGGGGGVDMPPIPESPKSSPPPKSPKSPKSPPKGGFFAKFKR